MITVRRKRGTVLDFFNKIRHERPFPIAGDRNRGVDPKLTLVNAIGPPGNRGQLPTARRCRRQRPGSVP